MAEAEHVIREKLAAVSARQDFYEACQRRDSAAIMTILRDHKVTQGWIAGRTGLAQSTLSNYKRGVNTAQFAATFEKQDVDLDMARLHLTLRRHRAHTQSRIRIFKQEGAWQRMSQVTWNFERKRVLVTGGAAGIGFAIGQEFLHAGAQVTFLGRDEKSLERAIGAASAASSTGRALSLICDLAKPQDIVRAAQAVTELMGGVDILINNAGVGGSRSLVELSDEELDLHLNVNLRATILLTRELLRGMLEQGEGVIINISSQAGKRGFPGITHYSASKAGVIGFTRSLAVEVAPQVRVNAVCPGMVLTAMMQNNIQQTSHQNNISLDDARAEWSSGIPMGRMQQAVDVANAVLFLASDAAREITGEALNVSGGQTMS